MSNLYHYTQQLANAIQASWERSERLVFRNLADSAPCPDTRRECRTRLRMMEDGLHDYRRNYRVDEKDGNYRVIYNCNVSGLPMVHCVVGKKYGDVARYTSELIDEPHFPYNLLDPRSRESCLAAADFERNYLG